MQPFKRKKKKTFNHSRFLIWDSFSNLGLECITTSNNNDTTYSSSSSFKSYFIRIILSSRVFSAILGKETYV